MEQVALEEPEELALVVDVESSTRFCVKHQLIWMFPKIGVPKMDGL